MRIHQWLVDSPHKGQVTQELLQCEEVVRGPTIISSYEGISIFVFQLSIDIFFCLFQSDVHVAIKTC